MPAISPKSQIAALNAMAAHILALLPKGGRGATEAITKLHDRAVRLGEVAKALNDLHATPNPTETPAAHVKRVSTGSKQATKEIEAVREQVQKIVQDGRNLLQARIEAKTHLVPDAYAAEVRTVFRSMPHTERMKFLTELVQQKRSAEFAAIIKAPPSVTGLPETMRQQFEDVFIAEHAAAELLDKAALEETAQALETAVSSASQFAAVYNDPAKLAEIAKAEEAAGAAARAFESTVRP